MMFISYSHQDRELMEKVKQAITRAGIKSFSDIEMNPGVNMQDILHHTIEASNTIVAILTKNSIGSGWVKRELKWATGAGLNIILVCTSDALEDNGRRLRGDLQEEFGKFLRIQPEQGEGIDELVGKVPKVYEGLPKFEDEPPIPLSKTNRGPRLIFSYRDIQNTINQCSFGSCTVVVPTNREVVLSGDVTKDVLNHLNISVGEVKPEYNTITCDQVCKLKTPNLQTTVKSKISLVATTVFPESDRLKAADLKSQDQGRAAAGILQWAKENKQSLVIVPPLGTGPVLGWPPKQAIVSFVFGIFRWCSTNEANLTYDDPWIVVCAPVEDGVRRFAESLSPEHRLELLQGKLRLGVRHNDIKILPKAVSISLTVGQAVKQIAGVYPADVKSYGHAANLTHEPTGEPFEYNANTPLGETIFSDGDSISVKS
jgi:hypothetical protein